MVRVIAVVSSVLSQTLLSAQNICSNNTNARRRHGRRRLLNKRDIAKKSEQFDCVTNYPITINKQQKKQK